MTFFTKIYLYTKFSKQLRHIPRIWWPKLKIIQQLTKFNSFLSKLELLYLILISFFKCPTKYITKNFSVKKVICWEKISFDKLWFQYKYHLTNRKFSQTLIWRIVIWSIFVIPTASSKMYKINISKNYIHILMIKI